MRRSLLILTLLLALAPLALPEEPSKSPVSGKIVGNQGQVWFTSTDGHQYLIDGEMAVFTKYIGYRLELLDPHFPTSSTIQFSRYRILENERGDQLMTPPREVMSMRDKKAAIDFQVFQEDARIRFVLYLTNRGREPVKLRFPSSQQFDFVAMTPDEKETLWRWSWGKKFEIGYNDLVLAPHSERRIEETLDLRAARPADGEYILFAEIHCLPHGIVSEQRRLVLQSDRHRVLFQNYFLPLEVGNAWTYRPDGGGASVTGRVTGTARLGGREYFVLSLFPDGQGTGTADAPDESRFIRFDTASSSYLEWTPAGERALLLVDKDHRLVPFEGACTVPAGRFDTALSYQIPDGQGGWATRFILVPGVGLVRTAIAQGTATQELVLESFAPASASTRTQASTPSSAPGDFRILLRKRGGVPAIDRTVSLRSDGSVVVLEKGELVRQGALPPLMLWNLLQSMDSQGLFNFREKYGEADIDNPLVVELQVAVGSRSKSIIMRTSAKDKPPIAFWTLVDGVEAALKKLP